MSGYNISFVFPMFNESENIASTIHKASDFAGRVCGDYEIIVIDDASNDGSGEIVRKLSAEYKNIKLFRLAKNSKFGGALNEGLMRASKDIVVYTDSDFPAREEDVKKALDLLGECDIVTAYSLVIKDLSFKRIVMSRVYNFLVQLLFNLNLRDVNSGLKVYRKKVFDGMKLKSKSPFIDVEIFVEAVRRGFSIRQHGLIFELRAKGHSRISRMDVVARTFWDMLVYKFSR